jgi:hypothetical protein
MFAAGILFASLLVSASDIAKDHPIDETSWLFSADDLLTKSEIQETQGVLTLLIPNQLDTLQSLTAETVRKFSTVDVCLGKSTIIRLS